MPGSQDLCSVYPWSKNCLKTSRRTLARRGSNQPMPHFLRTERVKNRKRGKSKKKVILKPYKTAPDKRTPCQMYGLNVTKGNLPRTMGFFGIRRRTKVRRRTKKRRRTSRRTKVLVPIKNLSAVLLAK